MSLPQNTIFFDLDQFNKNDLYNMRPLATHIHSFMIPKAGYTKLGISVVDMNCEDLTLKGWFSSEPMGQQLFYGNSSVNYFNIKKNSSYDDLYSGSNGSVFIIYDRLYDFKDMDKTNLLILDSDVQYYVNLKNLQNKEKSYKFVIRDNTNDQNMMDENECIRNYKVSDKSNMYPHFRYPSDRRQGW